MTDTVTDGLPQRTPNDKGDHCRQYARVTTIDWHDITVLHTEQLSDEEVRKRAGARGVIGEGTVVDRVHQCPVCDDDKECPARDRGNQL